MEIEGILLNLTHDFAFFLSLKAQILEICPSAQESADFYHIIDILKIFITGQKWPAEKFRVMIVPLNLQEDMHDAPPEAHVQVTDQYLQCSVNVEHEYSVNTAVA